MDKQSFKFEIKAVSDAGTFTGLASVYGNKDLGGDIVEPGAFTRTLQHRGNEVPILWQHNLREPIGLGKLKETPKGLEIAGELVLETGKAQEAYALLKRRVLKGLSIGYDVVKDTIANGVRHLHELKLYEVSLVTLPMNELATITDLKAQGGNELAMFREILRDCAERFKR